MHRRSVQKKPARKMKDRMLTLSPIRNVLDLQNTDKTFLLSTNRTIASPPLDDLDTGDRQPQHVDIADQESSALGPQAGNQGRNEYREIDDPMWSKQFRKEMGI
eukprot:GHVR01125207.1.p1 GENE.GHVR01125207.1~~GHVR01125207.1.p1  ORF type:complete len:104 (-),score=9.69 GHVR01125207.1:59-370(-)